MEILQDLLRSNFQFIFSQGIFHIASIRLKIFFSLFVYIIYVYCIFIHIQYKYISNNFLNNLILIIYKFVNTPIILV